MPCPGGREAIHVSGRAQVAVSGQPVWLGNADRPLFGWLHAPERVSGAVVLCLPIGDESFAAYRAYRLLAQQLESCGVAALRFDYLGTGDSAGLLEDVKDVGTWITDISRAVEFVRESGACSVVLVGMRVGALLARRAASLSDVRLLALWDPCESGRGFLREQRLLGATGKLPSAGQNVQESPDVEIQGAVLPGSLAASLEALDLLDDSAHVLDRLLLLVRPGRSRAERVQMAVPARSIRCEEVLQQERFFDVDVWNPFVDDSSVRLISRWCVEALGANQERPSAVAAPPAWRPAIVQPEGKHRAVVETPVSLGAGHIFGIVSEPAGVQDPLAPAVALLNMGLDRHTGPSRMWPELARSWAGRGVRVLRFDLSGIGDSGTRADQLPEIVYPATALEDIAAAACYLAPGDPARVLLVGACSGGYHATEGGAALNSKAVWLINPAVPSSKALRRVTHDDTADTDRRAVRRLPPIVVRLAQSPWAARLAHFLMPRIAWRVLDATGLYPFAARAFRTLVKGGTDTYVLCGAAEARKFVAYGTSELRRLSRSGHFHFEVADDLDHTLLRAHSRQRVSAELSEYVLGPFSNRHGCGEAPCTDVGSGPSSP